MSLTAPEFIQARLRRPAAIFGGGVSGAGAGELLDAIGARHVTYDARGLEFAPVAAGAHDLVIVSPGFAAGHPWLQAAQAAGAVCLGELDFASLFWRGRIVAVTGTNGKTTLTEFLVHALRAAGENARAAGNIGHPLSRLALETRGGAEVLAVCEVSSFQAEGLRHFRADATLWTNLAEDHLERHGSLEAYFDAKWRLGVHTTSSAWFAGSSVGRHALRFGRELRSLAIVETETLPPANRLEGTVFAAQPQRENFELARAWWRATGRDEAALLAAARSFRLGRHRLARVGEHSGVGFWNDSKATNFHAVEAALAGFDRPVLLIAGGKSKGGDLAGFVRRIAPRLKHACLIGDTGPELAAHCAALRVPHTACASLAGAVAEAAARAVAGDTVLLSPGFASFDQFRSYEDRGDQFERLVHGLGTVSSLR